jgi:hypothetical protein
VLSSQSRENAVLLANSDHLRRPVSQIESLTQLLEVASARAHACKDLTSSDYERCVADVRDIIRQLSEVVADEWERVLASEEVN